MFVSLVAMAGLSIFMFAAASVSMAKVASVIFAMDSGQKWRLCAAGLLCLETAFENASNVPHNTIRG